MNLGTRSQLSKNDCLHDIPLVVLQSNRRITLNPLVGSDLKNNSIHPQGSCLRNQRQPRFGIFGNLDGVIQIRCQFDFLCAAGRCCIDRVIRYTYLPLHAIQRHHNGAIGAVVGKDEYFALHNRIGSGNRNRSLIRRSLIHFDFPSILRNGFNDRILRCAINRIGYCFALSSVENDYVRCVECNCKLRIIAFGDRDDRIVIQCEVDIIIVFSYTFEYGSAIHTVLAINPIFSIFAVCSRCLSYISPSLPVIH